MQSFSRAVHINPDNRELWEDDLQWACSLLQKRKILEEEKKQVMEENNGGGVKIIEVGSDADSDDDDDDDKKVIDIYTHVTEHSSKNTDRRSLKNVPTNYVQMRDHLPP